MNWIKDIVDTIRIGTADSSSKVRSVPEGVWNKCNKCGQVTLASQLQKNLMTCVHCSQHMRIGARQRLQSFLDKEYLQEIQPDMVPVDVLKFKDSKKYPQRVSLGQTRAQEKEALIAMQGKLKRMPVVACAFEFQFMGGSMGSVVGDKFVLCAELALKESMPLICFSASGGARMQENMFSLMQMARTSAAIARLKKQGVPFVSVLTDPTMGGVSASLAMLGDVNIAEPGALIGFAGPRVIEQTVKQKLPKKFQTSEFLLERGVVDLIVHRKEMRNKIADILAILTKQPAL